MKLIESVRVQVAVVKRLIITSMKMGVLSCTLIDKVTYTYTVPILYEMFDIVS
jgi:hypothetical protein